MKIAFIITSLDNKGPIIMLQSLVRNLVAAGTHCDVYYFDELNNQNFDCKVQRIGFLESIDFGAYDFVHSHLFRPDLYCAFHYRKIHASGAKLISSIHTAIYDDLSFTYGKMVSKLLVTLWRWAWKKMDHVVVLTDSARNYYQNTKFKDLSVINNGRDMPSELKIPYEDRNKIQLFRKDHILLGTVCSIDIRKGLEQVLKLLVLNRNYTFIVIGDGTERYYLERMAESLGVGSRFKILGYRSGGYRYIPNFDVYVLPSRSEGMPMALLEAMALRVPIVCSRIPALAEEFSEEVCYYFELDQPEDLAAACAKAVLDPRDKVNTAFNCYEKKYTGKTMAHNYLKLYESIMNMQ